MIAWASVNPLGAVDSRVGPLEPVGPLGSIVAGGMAAQRVLHVGDADRHPLLSPSQQNYKSVHGKACENGMAKCNDCWCNKLQVCFPNYTQAQEQGYNIQDETRSR